MGSLFYLGVQAGAIRKNSLTLAKTEQYISRYHLWKGSGEHSIQFMFEFLSRHNATTSVDKTLRGQTMLKHVLVLHWHRH